MPEIVAKEDKYVTMVPSFQLPKDFDKKPEAPKPDIAQAAPPEEAKPAEQAPATEGAEPEQAEPQTTAKEPEKPEEKVSPRRFERRIDRATKRAAEAEARAEALSREMAELRAKQVPVADPNEPKMADYTDIEEYAKAKSDYKVQQDRKERESKAETERTEKSRTALAATWAEKASEGEDKYDDFAEVVGDLKPTTPWAMAIMEADNAHDIAYYLGKHMKEAQRIIALPPVSQIREIGKLEMKLAAREDAPKKPSQAPKPITPVAGAAEVPDNDISKPMSFEQYQKMGNKMFRGR